MPGTHMCEAERSYLQVSNKAFESVTDCCSSIESSFDSDSHGAKECVAESPRLGSVRRVCIVEEAEPLPQKSALPVSLNDEEETSCLRRESDTADVSVISDNYLTMSGTIQRGRKKGQNVDVILNMSREELEGLEATLVGDNGGECRLGAGPHVLLFTLCTAPFVAFISAFYSFFIGTLAWYNIFMYFAEGKSRAWWRVVLAPVLVLTYPFVIVSLSAGLGLVSAVWQVTWFWEEWLEQVADLEKGFFNWLCNALGLPDCSPYEVIILSGMQTTSA